MESLLRPSSPSQCFPSAPYHLKSVLHDAESLLAALICVSGYFLSLCHATVGEGTFLWLPKEEAAPGRGWGSSGLVALHPGLLCWVRQSVTCCKAGSACARMGQSLLSNLGKQALSRAQSHPAGAGNLPRLENKQMKMALMLLALRGLKWF